MAEPLSEIGRTFGALSLVGLLLLFGLAPMNLSLAVLVALVYLGLLVLILYFRSNNRKE